VQASETLASIGLYCALAVGFP